MVLFIQSQILLYDLTMFVTPSTGVIQYSPLGLLYLNKLKYQINNLLKQLNYGEISIGSISNINLWQKSGRFDFWKDNLFVCDKLMFLPTAEEQIVNATNLLLGNKTPANFKIFNHSNKFRNEKRAQANLYRSYEFLMMDAYSRHDTKKNSYIAYFAFKRKLKVFLNKWFDQVKFIPTQDTAMGNTIWNEEIVVTDNQQNNIEIGHLFCLGNCYTENNVYLNSYGIGTSRCLSVLLSSDTLWSKIKLFDVAIILKTQYKIDKTIFHTSKKNILIFDAMNQTINNKMILAEQLQIPTILLYDKSWYEIIDNTRHAIEDHNIILNFL